MLPRSRARTAVKAKLFEWPGLSRGAMPHFNVLDTARSGRKRQPVFAQTFQVKRNGFAYFNFGFFDSRTCCDTPGQIGNIGRVVVFRFLDDDGMEH